MAHNEIFMIPSLLFGLLSDYLREIRSNGKILARFRGPRGLSGTAFVLNSICGRNLSAAGSSLTATSQTYPKCLRFVNIDKDWEFGLLLFVEHELGRK